MIFDESLLKQHFVGKDGYRWWIGQIAPEETWKENIPGKPLPNNQEERGFGERYRVRIMGSHTDRKNEVEDENLPWAYIQYPVTAGSGGRSGSQSSNLAAGTFVKGYYIDGDSGQIPIIEGIIGNNDYQAFERRASEEKGFVPHSGYLDEELIATFNVKAFPSQGLVAFQEGMTGQPINEMWIESAQINTSIRDFQSFENAENGKIVQPIAEASQCNPAPTGKLQNQMQNAMHEIEKLKKSVYDRRAALSVETADIEAEVEKQIEKASKLMSGTMKNMIGEIEKTAIRKLNDAAKPLYMMLFPNQRPALKMAMEGANDALACAFKQAMAALPAMASSGLKEATNRAVNTSQCMVDNFQGQTLGQVAGAAEGTINQALGGINGLAGQASDVSEALSNISLDLLSFLNCEEKPKCPENNQWSIWSGTRINTSGSDIQNLMGISQNVSQQVARSFDSGNFEYEIDTEGMFNSPNCSTAARACGPPNAVFYGGSGHDAAGNLIISAAGEVLGIDMISFGEEYDEAVSGYVYDDCGNGGSAVIEPVVEEYTKEDGTKTKGIVDIIVKDPGANYLAAPNGATGGEERIWANPEDTTIEHGDGTIEVPIPPGNIIDLIPGDIVETPPGTIVETEPVNDDLETGGETIIGGLPNVIEKPGRITTPFVEFDNKPGPEPSLDDGAYPVILYLCEIIISEAGVNYSEGDEVIIRPDFGSKAEAQFDEQGRVLSVKVTEGGEGFKEMPKVFIKSDTGINSVLLPKFCVEKVGEDEINEPNAQDKIISVIDCVGRPR